MRISIVGENKAARTLKGYIEKAGYLVTNLLPTYVVNLEESIGDVIVDGIDSELERRIIYHMEDLGIEKFILQRANGIRSDREIRIIYPAGKDELVARAIARTISEKPSKKFWSKKLFLVPFLLLIPSILQAQQFTYGRAWDSVNVAPVDPGDSVNRALRVNVVASAAAGSDVNLVSISGTSLTGANVVDGANTAFRVNCVSGCVAGGSFADSSAFSFGATPVGLSAFVVDDVATNTVAENSAGSARMNTNRIPYFDLSKSAANTTAFLVTGTGGTFPVTGTFWPTTSAAPSSTRLSDGTNFYNALTDTQLRASAVPISGTVTATGPLTDTQLRATPVPVSGTVTVTDGAGALNVIVDSGSTVVTQGTGTNLHTVLDSGTLTSITNTVTTSTPNVSASGALTGTACATGGPPPTGVGCINLATTNLSSFAIQVPASGTGVLTFTFDTSQDGGTTWTSSYMWNWTTSVKVLSVTLSNPNTALMLSGLVPDGSTHVRIKCSAFTSGSSTLTLSGNRSSFPVWYQSSIPGIAPVSGVPAMGSDGTNVQYIRTDASGYQYAKLLDSAAADLTSAKGTQTSRFIGMQSSTDAGRVSRMFTASVASTATAETLITLTYSNGLAATSTCSSCAVTTGKKLRIMSMWVSARNSTGTTASNVTVNLRAAAGGATTASSPLQMHFQAPLPASAVAVLFPPAIIPESFEIDANSGTNTFGVTITHPQWVTGSVVATFDISIAAYEY